MDPTEGRSKQGFSLSTHAPTPQATRGKQRGCKISKKLLRETLNKLKNALVFAVLQYGVEPCSVSNIRT